MTQVNSEASFPGVIGCENARMVLEPTKSKDQEAIDELGTEAKVARVR